MHSFSTTGTANYRVQLTVSPLTNNNHNHNNIVFTKLTNKYTKKSARVGIIKLEKSTETSWSSAQH